MKRLCAVILSLIFSISLFSCAKSDDGKENVTNDSSDTITDNDTITGNTESVETEPDEPTEPHVPELDVEKLIAESVNFTDGGACGESLTWRYTQGTIVIFGSGYMDDYEVGSRPWEDLINKITTVVIDEGCLHISDDAFNGCRNLTAISLPDTLFSMGTFAFASCGLTAIRIPANLSANGNMLASAFAGNDIQLFEVDENNTNYSCVDGVVFDSDMKTLMCYPCADERASYEIPSGVTKIVGYAFFGCQYLEHISVPSSVSQIVNRAFYGCFSLKTIDLPNSITSIATYAFASCGSLDSITIPDSCIRLGDYAFSGCKNLTEVTIPSGIANIGKYCFTDSGVTSITYSGTLTGYPWGASIA